MFGRVLGFPARLDLLDLDGSDGFRIVGVDPGDQSGAAVSAAGDVDGDGIDDLIIGAPGASPGKRDGAGESYVVFGRPAGFPERLHLVDLDGSDGFRIVGIDAGDGSGTAVRGAGDVDGDGFDDLLIGAPGADPGGRQDAGETYVVLGRAGGFPERLYLADLDGVDGFRIVGIDAGDRSGTAVGGAGDVDRDGFDDLIIGAPDASPRGLDAAGETYLIFGRAGFPERLELLSALDGTAGFRITGIDQGDRSGQAVGGAGDLDGDRFDDLIIGAPGASPGGRNGAGESYVIFGQRGDFPERLRLGSLDGVSGFRIVGISRGDQSGQAVGGAGDVDGDGFDDVVVGAPGPAPTAATRPARAT